MPLVDPNSGPTTEDSFRSILEDPEFTRSVVWFEGDAVEQDESTAYEFGPAVETEMFIDLPDADDLEILPTEPDEDVEYKLGAFLDRGVTKDDRLIIDDGMGDPTPYRVGAPEVTDFDGDRFAWYGLTRDRRGDGSDDGSDDSGDYPTR